MHIDLRIYEQSAAINDRDWKPLIRMMIRSAPKVLLARSLLHFNCKIRFHDNKADPDTTESSDRGIYRVERTNNVHKICPKRPARLQILIVEMRPVPMSHSL
jgi:hypothetical protein